MRYVINDVETKSIKRAIKKFGSADISKFNTNLKGSFTITHFRKYDHHHEVDIEFRGELLGTANRIINKKWYSSEVYNEDGYSKVKINRLIKSLIWDDVKTRCSYFGINIKWRENIKKIKWI